VRARGLIVDLDSIIKVDELLSAMGSNTRLQHEDTPPILIQLKDRLNFASARGF
jgi:hypothetical protein